MPDFLLIFSFVLSGFVIFANYAERLQKGFGFWRFYAPTFRASIPIASLYIINTYWLGNTANFYSFFSWFLQSLNHLANLANL